MSDTQLNSIYLRNKLIHKKKQNRFDCGPRVIRSDVQHDKTYRFPSVVLCPKPKVLPGLGGGVYVDFIKQERLHVHGKGMNGNRFRPGSSNRQSISDHRRWFERRGSCDSPANPPGEWDEPPGQVLHPRKHGEIAR
ncbi:hypothetical protein RUM44_009347 [Polyplax serrata]|uniref:Uncharacterized protein n=1 Tax=Polyplax serrata TaxID=468196 RepID=A0ABR1ASF8_POLSC